MLVFRGCELFPPRDLLLEALAVEPTEVLGLGFVRFQPDILHVPFDDLVRLIDQGVALEGTGITVALELFVRPLHLEMLPVLGEDGFGGSHQFRVGAEGRLVSRIPACERFRPGEHEVA